MIRTKVIFLCTGNSARSQMAEGWMRHLVGDSVEVLSAGLVPKGVNPNAVHAMREVGVDISAQESKDVRQFLGRPIQIVVSVCDRAHEKCPIFPFAYKYLHWSIPDPAALPDGPEQMQAFRTARNMLRERIIGELMPLFPSSPEGQRD